MSKSAQLRPFRACAFDGTGVVLAIDGFGFGGLDDLLKHLWAEALEEQEKP